jgi:fumarate hydratase class II
MRLAQGGTAVGTGLKPRRDSPRPFQGGRKPQPDCLSPSAPNKVRRAWRYDTLVELSGVAQHHRLSACPKIANDIRLLARPALRPRRAEACREVTGQLDHAGQGQSDQCEMMMLVAAQVMGNHVAVTVGGLQGHMELNVFKPLIGANVVRSINLLTIAMESFTERTLDGLEPDEQRISELMNRSLMLVTALAPEIGYDNAATIAKHAHKKA